MGEHEGSLPFLSQVRTWPMSTVWWEMLALEVVEARLSLLRRIPEMSL